MPASAAFLTSGGGLLSYNLFYQHNINDASIIVITVGTFTFFFGLLADQIAHIRRELGRFTLMDLAAQRTQPANTTEDDRAQEQLLR